MDRPVVAAIDVGGTRIKSALVTREGVEVVALTRPTPERLDVDGALVDAAVDTVGALRDAATRDGHEVAVAAVGLVVPGIVDDAQGSGAMVGQPGLARPARRRAAGAGSSALPGRVRPRRACRAGGRGQVRRRARLASNAVFVRDRHREWPAHSCSTDGSSSADGWSGELGHLVVEPGGPRCGCGGRGCLEAVASAAAVESAYAAPAPATRRDAAAVAELVARVETGRPPAVWQGAVDALARAVVATVTLTGVERVVVGGGLSRSGEVLLRPLRSAVESALTFQRRPTIVQAALGDRAGCLGAACLAWDRT